MTAAPPFLRLRVVDDAVVTARPVLDDWSGGAGILRRRKGQRAYLPGSGIRRAGREQIRPPQDPTAIEPADSVPAAVFGGYLFDHYGHFLLESLARCWAPHPDPAVPIVWIAAWTEHLSPWMTDVLDVTGMAPNRRVVTAGSGALRVGELLVPDPGFEFGTFMHRWLGERLGAVDLDTARSWAPAALTGDHVWLSRSTRSPISGLDDEAELEAELAEAGWLVLHPEQHSVREQIGVLAGAVHVAGLEGSAFHTLALLRGWTGVVDLLTRQHHPNFELVADACGLRQVRHTIPGATPQVRQKVRGTDVQWSGADIPATVELLRVRCEEHGG